MLPQRVLVGEVVSQSVPLVPVTGRTAFQPCWRDCFQPNVWKAVGSFFLGCGLLVQPASSRGLVCTELLKQPGSLARTWLWGAVGQPGQASPSTPGAHQWDIAPELSIAVCKALGGWGSFKGTRRVFVCWGKLQTSYSEPAQAVLLAVIVFYCWYPGEMLGWGRTEMSLKIENCN